MCAAGLATHLTTPVCPVARNQTMILQVVYYDREENIFSLINAYCKRDGSQSSFRRVPCRMQLQAFQSLTHFPRKTFIESFGKEVSRSAAPAQNSFVERADRATLLVLVVQEGVEKIRTNRHKKVFRSKWDPIQTIFSRLLVQFFFNAPLYNLDQQSCTVCSLNKTVLRWGRTPRHFFTKRFDESSPREMRERLKSLQLHSTWNPSEGRLTTVALIYSRHWPTFVFSGSWRNFFQRPLVVHALEARGRFVACVVVTSFRCTCQVWIIMSGLWRTWHRYAVALAGHVQLVNNDVEQKT